MGRPKKRGAEYHKKRLEKLLTWAAGEVKSQVEKEEEGPVGEFKCKACGKDTDERFKGFCSYCYYRKLADEG